MFDKVVLIEMFEVVGYEYLSMFFGIVYRVLKFGGWVVI